MRIVTKRFRTKRVSLCLDINLTGISSSSDSFNTENPLWNHFVQSTGLVLVSILASDIAFSHRSLYVNLVYRSCFLSLFTLKFIFSNMFFCVLIGLTFTKLLFTLITRIGLVLLLQMGFHNSINSLSGNWKSIISLKWENCLQSILWMGIANQWFLSIGISNNSNP